LEIAAEEADFFKPLNSWNWSSLFVRASLSFPKEFTGSKPLKKVNDGRSR